MPLSDLFKKSPKQEPPKRPSQEDAFGSPALQKNRVDAATEVMGMFERNFGNPQGVHLGTVLSTAAWLVGTSLYRSFGYTHSSEPGTIMLSEKANQEFPKLINLFTYYMFQSGAQIKQDQFILQTPDMHKPLKTIFQVQQAYQDEYNAIMKRHNLDYLDGARAGVIVCSMLLSYHCIQRKDMDPRLAAGIVAVGIVTGAKTVPAPLGSADSPSAPSSENNAQNNQLVEVLKSIAVNSTNGSGTRLVLGEGMQSMGEALGKGGKYILLHPEVVNKLKQNNIDPYLVYEVAMRIEIGGKIPQIDFVGGNADELLQTWRGKPQGQTPIHVRQLLWLAENANGLGYEQRGNSWHLKR